MNRLTVRNLNVFYGPLQAVRDLSFDVPESEIVTLVGSNGAGKTSVIRAVAGLVPVRRATVELDGKSMVSKRPEGRVRLGLATVQENRELFGSLSVDENLRMGGYHRTDLLAYDLAFVYDLFPALASRRHLRAGALSGGQGQMLALGRALMSAPTLLLLDEPSHGLAPNLVDEMFHLIPRLVRERDLSILLVEQNAGKALKVASYGYVLETGSLSLQGSSQELSRNPRVKQLYLGG